MILIRTDDGYKLLSCGEYHTKTGKRYLYKRCCTSDGPCSKCLVGRLLNRAVIGDNEIEMMTGTFLLLGEDI